jgi:hypothetical protein
MRLVYYHRSKLYKMEEEYSYNDKVRPENNLPFNIRAMEQYPLDVFIQKYYHRFRAQEEFDEKPPNRRAYLTDIYRQFADDWDNVTPAVERANGLTLFGRRLGPMGKIAFLKRLSNTDQEYMRKLHKKTADEDRSNRAMIEKNRRLKELSRLMELTRIPTPTHVDNSSVQPLPHRSKVLSRIRTQNFDEYDSGNHPSVHNNLNHSKIPENKPFRYTPTFDDDDI